MTLDAVTQRFWAKVRQGTGCWEWTGALRNGYGVINDAGHVRYAHRLAYLWLCGDIPEGLCVLHHCDNPVCVNPQHLFLGTKRDNTQDMIQKGRARGAPKKTVCKYGHPLIGANRWTRTHTDGHTYGICRICGLENARRYARQKKEAGLV